MQHDQTQQGRESFVFYRSFFEAISALPAHERAAVYEAICAYALDGVETPGKGVPQAIFTLIRPVLDSNQRRYEIGRKGGRPKKERQEENQSETKAKPNHNQSETKAEPYVDVDVDEDADVDADADADADEAEAVPADAGKNPPASAASPRPYGQYGWVKLKQAEYDLLAGELGRERLAQCITCVDECAQSTGNKNRWKDWVVVLRRCHREGWCDRGGGKGRTAVPTGCDRRGSPLMAADMQALERLMGHGGP